MNRTAKKSTVVKKIAAVLWWVATILVAIMIVRILAAKVKGEVPLFFGYSVMNIVSGSMEDTIPEGSYILIKKADPSEIRKGDIICFYSDDPAIRGYPNTHTVVEDPVQGENGLEFVTKGDANPTKDSVNARAEKLIGKHVTNLDFLTDFSVMLEEKGLMIITLVLPVLCAICMVGTIYVKMKRVPEEEALPETTIPESVILELIKSSAGTSDTPPAATEEIPAAEPDDSDPPQA